MDDTGSAEAPPPLAPRTRTNLNGKVLAAPRKEASSTKRTGGQQTSRVKYAMSKKKFQAMRKRLDALEVSLAEDEKILFARSLGATPDERWRMHENFLRSLNLFTHSARKAYGFK